MDMIRFLLAVAGGLSCVAVATAGTVDDRWPEPTAEMKPWAYNWWMASAVDAKGLEHQCAEMSDKGFGGFHVIPIYGAKGGYEPKWRKLLSPEWIEAWNLAVRTAHRHGLGVDLTMGSGWCFGGPWVTADLGASSGMKVKRAGPGGEGLMIDPYSPAAMSNHVAQFEAAFGKDGTAERPRAFYHDSYEYYGAMPRGGVDIDSAQVACFKVWTDWCRANGYLTRNEAHGAPANWLDLYALADVPETEMFGKECRDVLISKFASSAAHVKGTTLVSAESCTWLDEHFCERPSEIKAFLDRLFLAGVNHVFYHGLCYSPVEAVWPGWCFYAATEMNPRNPIWREIGALNAYVTRCQSVFQTWTPDNDLAIVWDPSLHRADHPTKKGDFRMTVHDTDWFYGEKIGKLAKRLYDAGYSFDYVSPAQLRTADMSRYAEVVDPEKDEWPRTARRENFPLSDGLRFTRWKKGGRQQFFFVNEGAEDFVVSSDAPFVALDPLNGLIETVASLRLQPGHSIFVRGKPGFCRVCRARPENIVRKELKGGWRVAGVCGGPVVPAETNLASLVGWVTFDEFFSGTMRYETVFDAEEGHSSTLDLGDVREIAHVWLNGHDLGVAFMKPYSFEIPVNVLKAKDNHLVVEVTNLGANRLRWNDLTGVKWKYFTNANMVSIRDCPLDASTWTPHASGLLGPVSLVRSRATPYTHLNYLEDADEFRFAIIPDRYGADYRAKDYHSDYRGGFTNAIRVVNLLRPNFVMSVGDLIPYGWEGEASIRQQHRELKDELKKVVPPFFFVVGNHDISRSSDQPGHERDSEVSTRVWKDNWGPDTYYSFVYGNCLFVALNTIDDRTLTARHKDISDRQYAWFAKTLKDHPDVRWTFVFMHQPAVWTSPRWLDFELKNLVQRKYTVFAGDWHQYLHVRRHDHDYYVLATAGGCAGGGLAGKDMDKRGLLYGRAYGELDHVMWITMTKSGPVIANIDVTGVLNHDFVNQKTTKSLADMIELGYPPDPEVRRHMDEQKRRKAAIDAGEIPEPQPEDCKAEPANALKEMLEFARAAEKELKHTPTCGEKQSTFGSGDSTPRAVRTAICTMAVFDTLGKSGVEDAAHWEKLAAEVDKTLFFAAKTSVGKSKEALFKCFDGRNWGELGLQGFTEDFPRLEDADPFMKGNPRPLTVRTDPDWFPGVAEAGLPVACAYDRDARRAERAYRASCRFRGVRYAPPGRDVRAGGFLGLVKGVALSKGWYERDEYKLDTEVRETAPLGEGEGPNTVLRRQLRVRRVGPRTALVRERVFVLKDCELPRGLLAVPFAEGSYLLLEGENRRIEGCLAATAGETLYDVTYAVDADADAARLAACRGMRMNVAYVTEPGDETETWQAKIDAASAAGGGTVTVPPGAHKVAQLELKDNVTLELAEGATLFAVTNGTAYRWTPWIKAELQEAGVVVAYGATNVGIVGKGTIDGCGDRRPFFRTDEIRWRNVYMRGCRGVRIEGIRLDHPSFWTIFLRACDRVHVKGVTSRAFSNINNDGMDLSVSNALVEDCDIDSTDDALVLKGFDPDFVSENVEIRNCRIATTGNCIKFGTETFSRCRNYEIHHCSIGAADRFGPRAPNLVRYPMTVTNDYRCEGGLVFLTVDGGTIEDVRVHDVEIRSGVLVPFAFRLGRRYGEENWDRSVIRGVTLERVTMAKPALSAVGCFISGIAERDVEDVTIRDCHFRMRAFPDGILRLHEKFPENARRYPSPGMFDGALPGYFLFTTHAKNVRLENVKVDLTGEGEKRPAVVADEAGAVSVHNCAFGVFER